MLRIRRRILLWAAITVGLPLLARGLHAAANAIESATGPTRATGNLRRVGSGLDTANRQIRRGTRWGGRRLTG